ncbi:sodium- and chloride-dependent glycine transporter 2-like isoform X2 [Argopecten irradians]
MRIWLLEYLRQAFTTELPWTSCRHTWNTNSCVTSHAILSSSTNGSLRISTANISMNLNATAAMSAEEEFFKNNILSLSDGIEDVGYLRWNLVLWAIVIKTIIVIALLKSVKTIGKMMLVTTFLPLLIGLAMFIQSCTYSGVKEGILFLITPDFTKLSESRIWIEASFMAFYSLGPGWGGVMVMGSHMKFHNKCLRTVLVSVCGDVFFALYNSFILYAVLGVMASEIGVPLEDVVKSGMSVGLVGYSRALAYLPAPYIWSVVFFFSVLIVDLDAEVICTETVVSFLKGFGNKLGRHIHLLLVMLICLTTFLINLPFCTQAGPYMFQLVDWYLPTWSVVVIALSQTIAMMWLYGGDRIDSGLKDMIGRKMPHVLRVAASYISPVLLLMLLLVSFVRYRPPTYGSYEYPEYTHVIGWLLSCSIVVPIPLVIIVKIVNLQGSFMERWNTLTQPSRDWGPSDSAYRLQYLQRLQIKRSWADIAFYNLTGRQRYSSKGQSETLPLERVD